MALPDVTELQARCAVLEGIGEHFPEGSTEREAVRTAALAMHYVCHVETQAKFQSWVESWTLPPTALQVLHAKLAGIDELPHALLDDTLREVEQLLERLRNKRA